MTRAPSPSAQGRWLLVATLIVFCLHAAIYLYFFVDDEGIPLVYAQNVLHGKGLIYAQFEGPIEGYSDFLHVALDVVVLAAVRLVHAPKIAAFMVGKALSLLAGTGTIIVAFLTMRRARSASLAPTVAGMAVLTLAGPFAVWSASSLETVPFTFLVTLLTYTLYAGSHEDHSQAFDRLAAVAGALAILERLDGFIFVSVLVAAFLVAADSSRRRMMVRRVVAPLAGVFVAYHAWRIWYFQDLLNTPLYTKVMYKLRPNAQRVVKRAEVPYAWRFVIMYGWPALAAAVGAMMHSAWREAPIRRLLAALAVLFLYVATVGDWMFGFRFFVPLLPLAAVLVALTTATVFRWRPALAWVAAATIVVWCGVSARAFEQTYEVAERKPNWLAQPSLKPARLFGKYYDTYQVVRAHIQSGQLLAYNQAGFVPFMLDVENIDDLGICSRFYAELPSQDVFFTEVGRYAPLTRKPSIGAEEAYFLYRNVPFLIQRRDLLRKANDGRTPKELMGGYYTFLAARDDDGDAIYRRTDRDGSQYQHDPRLFFENLAHVAYVRTAAVNGRAVPPAEIVASLPLLREDTVIIPITDRYTLDVLFGDRDIPVSEIDINEIRATGPVAVRLELYGSETQPVHSMSFELPKNSARSVIELVPANATARRFHLEIVPAHGGPARVFLTDLRVQGQTPELARYIRENLPFPPK